MTRQPAHADDVRVGRSLCPDIIDCIVGISNRSQHTASVASIRMPPGSMRCTGHLPGKERAREPSPCHAATDAETDRLRNSLRHRGSLFHRRSGLLVVPQAAPSPPAGRWPIHGWIDGLNRYAALSLVVVPLAILEPVKPLGFYLTAKGHLVSGGSLIAMGEIVKVTLVEQVIEITKPKLLSFHWFAWMYSHWEAALDRLRSIRAWQAIKRQVQSTLARVRQMKANMEVR